MLTIEVASAYSPSDVFWRGTDGEARINTLQCLLTLAILCLWVLVFAINQWTPDDAFITFRTVDNFLGAGELTWNPHDRVQAFSHPLWFFLLLPPSAILSNAWHASILLSFLFSTWLIARFTWAARGAAEWLGIALLLCSYSYSVYAASGLENSLTHLLLAEILGQQIFASGRLTRRNITISTLLVALVTLTRPDIIILVIVPFAAWLWRSRRHAPGIGFCCQRFHSSHGSPSHIYTMERSSPTRILQKSLFQD